MKLFIHNDCDLEATLRFVREHQGEDVSALALQAAKYPGVDMRWALEQISGRQTARVKLPEWAACESIIYPPHLSMEQCSSQAAAIYKSGLMQGETLVDLTGGFGVDFSFMARKALRAVYVERQEHLCLIARHNFAALGLEQAQVVHGQAEQYLEQMSPVDCIYIDPARRDDAGNRVYAISQCTPDVAALAPVLLQKARRVIVKLSPMLDITQTLRELPGVCQVHVLAVNNECKELLVVMEAREAGNGVKLVCVNDEQHMECRLDETHAPAAVWDGTVAEQLYVYEPNAAIMKAGCHDALAVQMGLQVVSRDSHLMVGNRLVADFPGRAFILQAVSTMNKTELHRVMQGIDRANVAVRNFPIKAPDLSRRLRVSDGGSCYIFGTRLASGKPVLLVCQKA